MKRSYTGETIQIFWQHSQPYMLTLGLVLLCLLGAVGTNLYRPFIIKDLFDQLASPTSTQLDSLLAILYTLAWLTFVNWFLWRINIFVAIWTVPRILANLMDTCFDYLHGHSFDFFNNTFVGSLVAKVNRFARAYEKIFDQLVWSIIPAATTVLFILSVLAFRMPAISLIVLAWTTVYLAISYRLVSYKLKYNLIAAQAESETTAHLADSITNQINLKLFSSTPTEAKKFRKLTQKAADANIQAGTLDGYIDAFQGGSMFVLEFLVMWTAIHMWSRGQLTVGDFAFLQSYLVTIFHQLWGIGRHIRKIYEGLADGAEMTEILTQPYDVQDLPSAQPLAVEEGAIAFKNVTFAYHKNKNVFTDFNLDIKPGERVALIGSSGGGKSTIVKLLFRFFDIQKGEILIDGRNIAYVTQDSLRNQIALVPQEPVLFHRSLLENIRYAKPNATREEVIRAAKQAHCHEFISRFPEKYDTFVGERGVKLSGGERQRIAIARAILKDAPILVLDEATSSLDSESERYIQDALQTLMEGRTTIVIAHRLSTIMQMDRIVVIQNGRIVEEGKHQELLKVKQGLYQKLWEIQAGGFS